MNHVDLSGPYDFSTLDLGSIQVSVLFLLQLNKNFVINDLILLCNYATKIFWDDICEYYFSHSPLSEIYICVACFILCDHLPYYISMITRIISWGTSEYSLWLYSLLEYHSVSFHVLVVRHYWLRTSCGITLDDDLFRFIDWLI